jgi:sugar lactone lactonase YvrE
MPGPGLVAWLDQFRGLLHTLNPQTGVVTDVSVQTKLSLGTLALSPDPLRLWLTSANGLGLLHVVDGTVTPVVYPEANREGLVFNDGKADRFGRLWITSFDFQNREAHRSALYVVTADATVRLGDSGFAIPNGPAFSPDGRILYFSDTLRRQILAYDLTPSDTVLRNRRTFVEFPPEDGYPDGITVDVDGCLWTGHFGGGRVTQTSPEGKRLQTFHVPAPAVTSVAFGGQALDTLYVTSARIEIDAAELAAAPRSGSLFAFKPGARGIAEPVVSIGSFAPQA